MGVWPKTIPFDATAPSYGDDFLLYLGCIPRTADSTWKFGALHRGYGSAGTSIAASAGQSPIGDGDASNGFLHRRFFHDDVSVELVSRKVAVGPSNPTQHHPGHAVGARIQGGSIGGLGTVFVGYSDIIGYVLRLEFGGATTYKLKLYRFNAGLEALVDESQEFTPPASGTFHSDFRLKLTLTNNAGDVDYIAEVFDLAPSTESPGSMAPLTIGGGLVHNIEAQVVPPVQPSGASVFFSGTDTHADRVTTAGRSGFWVDRDRTEPGGTLTISVANLFRITSDPLGTPVVEWEDDFKRATLALGIDITDTHGVTGDSVQSEFHGDNFGQDQANILQRNSGGFVDVDQTESMGEAVSLSGSTIPGARLVLQDPLVTWPAPQSPISAQWTVLVWAKMADNRDGDGLWDQFDATANDGFAFGLIVAPPIGGKLAARFEVTLGDGTAPQVYTSSAFVVQDIHIGQAWAYAATYKANSNPGSGEGRLRYYVGRLGQVRLISETIVPNTVRPTWPDGFASIIGERRDKTGVPADRAFSGQIDEALVSFAELPADKLDVLANGFYLTQAQWIQFQVNVYAAWSMDAWSGAPLATFRTLGGGVGTGEFRVFDGAINTSPGLVPVRPVDKIRCHHQRKPDDQAEQRASVRMKIPNGDRGRVLVRTSIVTADHFSGYSLGVSPGDPAMIQLTQLAAFQGPGGAATIETILARQNLSTGSIAVLPTSYVKMDLEATQDSGGPTGNVTLKAFVNTVKPDWEIVGNNVFLDASGHIIDATFTRPLVGAHVGFECVVLGGTPMEVDDFVHETPSSLVFSPNSFPGYTLPAEADGKVGTLNSTILFGWGIQRRRVPPRKETRTYTPVRERMLLGTFARRYYDVIFVGASGAEVTTLLTFLDDHKGSEIPFDWDPSAEIRGDYPGVFHFMEDRIQVAYSQSGGRTYSFVLEELNSP